MEQRRIAMSTRNWIEQVVIPRARRSIQALWRRFFESEESAYRRNQWERWQGRSR
jgi:hypothetical protein